MRQLTSLDAQFLALETPRQTGPRRRAGDPRPVDDARAASSSSRTSAAADRRAPAAAAAAALAAGRGPVRPRLSVLGRRRRLRPRLPRPRARAARAGDATSKLAEQVARIVGAPARPRAAAVGALPDPRPRGRATSAMLTKIHHALIDGLSGAEIMGVLFDLAPEGREPSPRVERDRERSASPAELEMLARGLLGLPRYPLRALRSLPAALPNLDETPFRGTSRAPSRRAVAGRVSAPHRRRGDRRARPHRPATRRRRRFNGRISPHRRFAFGQLCRSTRSRRSRTSTAAPSTTSSSRSARARCAAG